MENMSIDKFERKIEFKVLQSDGYLLIELLIAVSMLSGVALLVFRYQWNIIQAQQNALRRSKAIDHAISWLEKISEKSDISPLLKKEIDGCKFTIKTSPVHVKYKPFKNVVPVTNFKRVTLEAKWADVAGKEKSFCIVTGIIKK